MFTDSALLTDQYELVMAHGYWHHNMAETESVFYLSYRSNPFKGHYVIACGLADVIRYLSNYGFTDQDITYLASCTHPDGSPLFAKDFLHYLRDMRFTCSVDAIPEGTVVFPQEPLLRVQGPIIQCQLLETALINAINYASLIATKASRVCSAAQGDPCIEFGLRRAHGPNGGLTASRAAYIGGCHSTSNVLAGATYDIPISGTMAHSWVMAFENELTAFDKFAQIVGKHSVLLVDTYHTLNGIKNAIKIGNKLRENGHDLAAIRLDSGDLAQLSIESRQLLDSAGFTDTKIFASGDLDEYRIKTLKERGARIDAWGVGTKLVTADDQPSLNTIYKLAAIKNDQNEWDYKLKISDHSNKTTMAGIVQVRRYLHQHHIVEDKLYDVEFGINNNLPSNADESTDLLTPVFKNGRFVYEAPSIHDTREFCIRQVTAMNQQKVSVKLETKLSALQEKLISS